ncbi:MAG: gluconate 2-dehydrogenase subunit 3 family protein [Terriglobia bacterium]
MSQKQKPDASGTLNRRDLLKAAMVAPTAALVQLTPALAAAPPSSGAPSAEYTPKVFNPRQWKTLQVLSDLIIPADERSGSATAAGVPEFIDDWLSLNGVMQKTELLGGLTWIDMECNRQFSHDFADCSETQQKQILDRIAYPAKAAPDDSGAVAAFGHIRDLVLGGFYSSKIGIEDLGYQGNKMLESWDGCPESATTRLGVDYSNWEHWKS